MKASIFMENVQVSNQWIHKRLNCFVFLWFIIKLKKPSSIILHFIKQFSYHNSNQYFFHNFDISFPEKIDFEKEIEFFQALPRANSEKEDRVN